MEKEGMRKMKAAGKLLLCVLLAASALLASGNMHTEASTAFKDINKNHYAYKEITYLAEGNITGGDASGNFQPKSKVTRAQFTALLGRALDLDGKQRKTKFRDVGSNNFASGYIQSAVDQNIISGYSDGSFKPEGYVTRGEMAVMISKAFGYNFRNSASGAAEAMVSRGIDLGAEDGTFGYNRSALREETATFLARAINYTLRTKVDIAFDGEKTVNTQSLNMRTGPSSAYPVIGVLNKQETVSVGYKVGNWMLVKSKNDTIGFVSNSYLSSSANDAPPNDGGNNHSGLKPLAAQTLVIDPGHGGSDPGAVGYGLKEKEVTLNTALLLKPLLAKTPLNVKYTRETDVTLDLVKDRVSYALSVKGDMFVSIHANAGGGTGSETYYYGKKATNPYVTDSKLLAEYIQKRLVVAMETKNRGFKHGNFHVIRENRMPAVLVELAFIDTKADNDKLKSTVYRQRAAEAIYLGILDYYQAKGYNVASYYKIVQ